MSDLYKKGLKALDGKYYDGYNFKFFMRNSDMFLSDIFAEEETGEIINDAVYKRNQEVSEKFGVKFSVIKSSNSNYETDAMKNILAGDDAYDVIVPHARAAFSYVTSNMLLDWRKDLPYVDLSKPWWSADMQKSFTIKNKLFTMTGDLSYTSLAQAHCLIFNKSIFDELGLDYPYDLVRKGDWTFEEMTKLADKAVKDINGDGVIKVDDDRIGYFTQQWGGPTDVIYTGGQRIFGKDDKGLPTLTLNSEKTITIFDKYFRFLDTDAAFCSTSTFGGAKTNPFRDDRAMFSTAGLNDLSGLRDMKSDFGVLPLPKFDKTDKYATIVDGSHNLYCVPITATDPSRTSVILEALSIIGSKEVIPAFYDVALQTKFTRDADSAEMIDIIRDSRVYDLGYLAGGDLQSAGRDLANSTSKDFASYYAQRETSVLDKIKGIVEVYTK